MTVRKGVLLIPGLLSPQAQNARTRARLALGGGNMDAMERAEWEALAALVAYDRGSVNVDHALDAVLEYDRCLPRSSEQIDRARYRRTLVHRPWENCSCHFWGSLGIHMLVFRGNKRNKGAHNALHAYKSLNGRAPERGSAQLPLPGVYRPKSTTPCDRLWRF